jgi:hypothetical protein
LFLNSRKYDPGVHPGSGSGFLPIPDPGVKKAPTEQNPWSRAREFFSF